MVYPPRCECPGDLLRIRAAFLVSAVLIGVPPFASAADQVEAGLWEVSVSVESSGMAAPPVVQTECLTREQANADPVPSLDKGACRAMDVRRAGGKVQARRTGGC